MPWWGPPSPTSPWRLGHDYDNLGGRPSGESRFRSKAEKFSLFLCWLFLIATYQQFCHWRCLWLRGWVGLWVYVVKLLANFASFGQSILSHRRLWYLLKRIAYLLGTVHSWYAQSGPSGYRPLKWDQPWSSWDWQQSQKVASFLIVSFHLLRVKSH